MSTPSQALVKLVAESLRGAGFQCEYGEFTLNVGGYRYYCTRRHLKTSVEFMGTMFRFTRRGVSPGVDVAVQMVIEDMGRRLAARKRREDELAKMAEKDRIEALKQQAIKERVDDLVERYKHTEGFVCTGNVVKFMDVRVQVTETDYIVTFTTKDFAPVGVLMDMVIDVEAGAMPAPLALDTRSDAEVAADLAASREEDGW